MKTKTAVFKKLAWVMQLYEVFHLVQNLRVKRRVSEGVDEKPYENGPQKRFFLFFFFDIYHAPLKIVTCVISYTDMHHW